jgi:hypothetical protein
LLHLQAQLQAILLLLVAVKVEQGMALQYLAVVLAALAGVEVLMLVLQRMAV